MEREWVMVDWRCNGVFLTGLFTVGFCVPCESLAWHLQKRMGNFLEGTEVAWRVEYMNIGEERTEKEWENSEWFVGIFFFFYLFI